MVEGAEDHIQNVRSANPQAALPLEWRMIDLDRLILWQRFVDLTFVDRLLHRLPPQPTDRELLDFCAIGGTEPPIAVSGTSGGNHFAFCSATNDFRVLDTFAIDPALVDPDRRRGRGVSAIAILVGYSPNAMWAVRISDRLVLINGTHRAYALRSRGVTQVPCLVSTVESRNDLEILEPPPSGTPSLEWHFNCPRPPLLRDFLDEELVHRVNSQRRRSVLNLELRFTRSRIAIP
jgi:hypothetical protein